MAKAKYNVAGDVLAQGINGIVRIDIDDENGSNPQVIGFVENWSMRKNMQTQEARVVGQILPVSIDVTGIQVQTSLSGFIPTKAVKEKGITSVRGGGTFDVTSMNPDDENYIDNRVITKIPYLDIYDERHKSVVASTAWLTPTSYSVQGNPQGYTKCDVAFSSIGMANGSDYEAII